jgi:hypothetical protein
MHTSHAHPRKILSTILSAAAMLLAAEVAQAADTLFTAPLVPEGTSLLDCYIVNVSKKTQDVVIQVFNRAGVALESVPASLAPGEERVATVPASADPNEAPRYCKFELDGKKTDFRASILTRTPGFGSISALPAQ